MATSSDRARLALGAIRMVNGAAALFAPGYLLRRLGADPAVHGVAVYPLRMFGVRTVVLAADLLWPPRSAEEARRRALYAGIVIHASDALSAASAGLANRLPGRVAAVATAVSVVNTGLAVAMARTAAVAARTAREHPAWAPAPVPAGQGPHP